MRPDLKPDLRVVRRLRRIDPELSVDLVPTPRGWRWAVFHGLQVWERYEKAVDTIAADFQMTAAKAGYLFDKVDCTQAAKDAVHMAKLVCYVTEPDGSFAPLDGRVVEKLQRMDYFRTNWGLKDWRAFLKIKADAFRDSQQRASDDIWDTIRRDKTFEKQVSDILSGTKTRSVIVPPTYAGGVNGSSDLRSA